MPRKKREQSPTGVYHWITRGINRKNLFRQAKDYTFFLHLVGEHAKQFEVQIFHYCLMTNHIHLLIFSPEFDGLVNFSHYLKRRYAYYQSKEYKISGPTFERMYRSKPIGGDVYLLECARYIDRNPLRAGIVQHPSDYAFGSYKTYAEGLPNPLITKSPAYLGLAADDQKRQPLYMDYVLQPRPQEEFASSSSIGL